ncbi:MAG: hypothetical protein AAGD25_15010 [Cyanobacteria bacterium P01_F01_bin.150]
MSEQLLCKIVVPSSLPSAVVEQLRSSIRLANGTIQETSERAFGADDIALLVTIAVGVGQLAEYGVKVAQSIINWRKSVKVKNRQVQGQLEGTERPPLDLETATDEEIIAWFRQR